jgi:hypothetical protein
MGVIEAAGKEGFAAFAIQLATQKAIQTSVATQLGYQRLLSGRNSRRAGAAYGWEGFIR